MSQLRHLLILSICTLILIMACARTPNPPISERTTPANPESCRFVKHEMGEIEVCGQLQRVASLTPYLLDYMLALGVQPIAHSDERWDPNIKIYDNPTEQIPYLGQWVKTKPIPLGDSDVPSFEALTLAQPDLILGEKWQEQNYALMTQIAPTLLFDHRRADGKVDWQHNIKEIALALDREAQAEELLTRHSQRMAEVREQLASVVAAHPRVLVLGSVLQNNRIVLGEVSTTARLLQSIGFEIVSSKNSSVVLPETKQSGSMPQISIELLPQIEADFICVLVWSKEYDKPQEIFKQQWAINPVLKQVPSFKEGKVFFVDGYLWGSGIRGPLTDKLILEELPKLLLPLVNEGEV